MFTYTTHLSFVAKKKGQRFQNWYGDAPKEIAAVSAAKCYSKKLCFWTVEHTTAYMHTCNSLQFVRWVNKRKSENSATQIGIRRQDFVLVQTTILFVTCKWKISVTCLIQIVVSGIKQRSAWNQDATVASPPQDILTQLKLFSYFGTCGKTRVMENYWSLSDLIEH